MELQRVEVMMANGIQPRKWDEESINRVVVAFGGHKVVAQLLINDGDVRDSYQRVHDHDIATLRPQDLHRD